MPTGAEWLASAERLTQEQQERCYTAMTTLRESWPLWAEVFGRQQGVDTVQFLLQQAIESRWKP